MCFNHRVTEPRERAAAALDTAELMWSSSGLTVLMRDLVREVWRTNVDRYEPDELGDNARTLGFQCSENLSTRIERRTHGHDLETIRWDIPGLTVSKPNGALRMRVRPHPFYVMKAPMVAVRQPGWDDL